MSTDETGGDIISRLKLDIRALAPLYESDADLRPVLERSFLESQDAYVRRFVGSPAQAGRQKQRGTSRWRWAR